MTGFLPDVVTACVGGGSNSIGMFDPFLEDPVEIVGVEPLGRGAKLGDHAASMSFGSEGVMHGFDSIMLKDGEGNPAIRADEMRTELQKILADIEKALAN